LNRFQCAEVPDARFEADTRGVVTPARESQQPEGICFSSSTQRQGRVAHGSGAKLLPGNSIFDSLLDKSLKTGRGPFWGSENRRDGSQNARHLRLEAAGGPARHRVDLGHPEGVSAP
jgi:hypothetical protein